MRRTSADYREDQRQRRADSIARKRERENTFIADDDIYEEDED